MPVAVVAALALVGGAATLQRSRERVWAREVGIPEIERLARDRQWRAAFPLAARVRRILPDDSAGQRAWRAVAVPTSVNTTPDGADVYVREAADTAEAAWRYLGRTPIWDLHFPRGPKRWRVEREGYAPLDTTAPPGKKVFVLQPSGAR